MEAAERRVQPYYLHRKDGRPVVIGGLYRQGYFSLLSCRSSPELASFDPRMPLILKRESWGPWLDPQTKVGLLLDLLEPFPSGAMTGHRVSKRVNDFRVNHQGMLDQLAG